MSTKKTSTPPARRRDAVPPATRVVVTQESQTRTTARTHESRPGTGAVPPAGQKPGRLKVRALVMGFYGNKRRRPGDVFVVEAAHFTNRWMEAVDRDTPTSITTGQQALNQAHDETLHAKYGKKSGADEGDGEIFE